MFPPKKINPKSVWKTNDYINNLDSFIVEGYKLEKEGREIASDREGAIEEKDIVWAVNLGLWHKNTRNFIESYNEVEEKEFFEELKETLWYGKELFEEIVFFCEKLFKKKRNITFEKIKEIVSSGMYYNVKQYLYHYDEHQYNLTGRKGIWMYGQIPEELYTYSAYINDSTSVFHQVLNFITQNYQNISNIYDKVYVIGAGNPYLQNLAIEWREEVLYLNDKYDIIYDSHDFKRTAAFVRTDELQVVVGSSPGHVTHIEPRLRGIVATYYDTDEDVHEVFMKLCDYWGISVTEHKEEESTTIFASRLNECDLKFIFVLPFVTSMDYRLDHIENISTELRDPVDIEVRNCINLVKGYDM